jgi:hypothetical protein
MLALAFVLLVAAVAFAEDALVLPQCALRVNAAGAYTMATQRFDSNGDKVDLAGNDSLTTYNVGGTLEYGIFEGADLAVWWVPGYNVYTTFASSDTMKIIGPFDLFVGARIQILGDRPVFRKLTNDTVRFTLGIGAVIPMPGADFDVQAANYLAGTEYIPFDPDRHAGGPWARASLDFVVGKAFFVNLFSEFILFPPDHQDFLVFMPGPGVYAATFVYGYQLTVEAEPHVQLDVAPGILLKAGVPITFVTWPDYIVESFIAPDSGGYKLNLRPRLALLLSALPLPIELEVGYTYPLAGKNVPFANNSITVQLKTLADFGRKSAPAE